MYTFSFYQNGSFFFISIFSREKKHIYMFIYSVCIFSFFQENFELIKLLPEEELNSSVIESTTLPITLILSNANYQM